MTIDCCFHIKQYDFLFSKIFPIFHYFGKDKYFVQTLEPFIFGNKIPQLPAEIISRIFEVYAKEKEFFRIEKMIIGHLNLASLDFQQVGKFFSDFFFVYSRDPQVVLLCRKHQLASSLFYMYIYALDEYVAPLEELMAVLLELRTKQVTPISFLEITEAKIGA